MKKCILKQYCGISLTLCNTITNVGFRRKSKIKPKFLIVFLFKNLDAKVLSVALRYVWNMRVITVSFFPSEIQVVKVVDKYFSSNIKHKAIVNKR